MIFNQGLESNSGNFPAHLIKLVFSATLLLFAILMQALQINFYHTDIIVPFYFLLAASLSTSLLYFYTDYLDLRRIKLICDSFVWFFEICFLSSLLFIFESGFLILFFLQMFVVALATLQRGENFGYILAVVASSFLALYCVYIAQALTLRLPLSLFTHIGFFGVVFFISKLKKIYQNAEYEAPSIVESLGFSSDVGVISFNREGALLDSNELGGRILQDHRQIVRVYIWKYLVSDMSSSVYQSSRLILGSMGVISFFQMDEIFVFVFHKSSGKTSFKSENLGSLLKDVFSKLTTISNSGYFFDVKMADRVHILCEREDLISAISSSYKKFLKAFPKEKAYFSVYCKKEKDIVFNVLELSVRISGVCEIEDFDKSIFEKHGFYFEFINDREGFAALRVWFPLFSNEDFSGEAAS